MDEDLDKEARLQAAMRQEEESLPPLSPTDPGATERLFLEHHRRVFLAAYRVTGNAMDAEDVLQTVFLRLLRRTDGASFSEAPASYFHLAAINGALDVVRARTTARTASLEEVEDLLADSPQRGPDARQDASEVKERLRRALSRMNPRAAQMFVLRYLEGYNNKEIARMLRKPQALVAVTLHRTRRRLREEIRPNTGGQS